MGYSTSEWEINYFKYLINLIVIVIVLSDKLSNQNRLFEEVQHAVPALKICLVKHLSYTHEKLILWP